jgi:hypothetical protein
VIDAQPISIHTVHQVPNDESYSSQWHLPRIEAPEAWDIETGNSNIVVAILDTGVRYFHKDLGGAYASLYDPTAVDGNMWINPNETLNGEDSDGNGYVDDWIGWDFVENTDALFFQCLSNDGEDCSVKDNDPRDFNGHGTHCAGSVGAMNNNSAAVASVAGGWGNGGLESSDGVKVMPLRIGWSAFYVLMGVEVGVVAMDAAAEAFIYAADNGAKIASCSWGSSNTGGLGAAMDYFLASGGLIFKAAGNDDDATADYMGGRDDVISVAATDESDCKASFSNYGDWVDISAPGVNILSLFHDHTDPVIDHDRSLNGTSMAAPLAAAVAALIWSQNPDWSADQVRQRLYASADPIDSLPCNNFPGDLITGPNPYHPYLNFDGRNEALQHGSAFRPASVTLEALSRVDEFGNGGGFIVSMDEGSGGTYRSCILARLTNGSKPAFVGWDEDRTYYECVGTTDITGDSNWYYLAGKYQDSNKRWSLFVNDSEEAFTISNMSMRDTGGNYGWAVAKQGPDANDYYLDGGISEVRVSKIARSDAWCKATYYSLLDSLLRETSSFSSSESSESSSSSSTSWNRYKQYTIDSSKVDSDLSSFPVTIILDGDDLDFFTELSQDSDIKKIKVTTDAAGNSECYVEIEHFSVSSQKCILHTTIPSISSSSDTEIYLWYDRDQPDNTTYVGDTGDAAAQNVWDDDFLGVYHMAQEPGSGAQPRIKDSTSNGYDLASENMESGYAYKLGAGRINAFQAVYTDNQPVNNPPTFNSDPITKPNATEGEPYSNSLSGDATDQDGDPLTFSKITGPTWLSVAADGSLSGTPTSDDLGVNSWTVQVADGNGGSDDTTLEITVDPTVPQGQVGVNTLETGKYVTTGRGKNKVTEFVETGTFSQGDGVVIRALVKDTSGPIANAVVDIEITGPETHNLNTGPSDNNGVAEAKWQTKKPNKRGRGGTATGLYTAKVSNVTAGGYTWDGGRTSTTFTISIQ